MPVKPKRLLYSIRVNGHMFFGNLKIRNYQMGRVCARPIRSLRQACVHYLQSLVEVVDLHANIQHVFFHVRNIFRDSVLRF